MEGSNKKKTVYLTTLENLEEKIKNLSNKMSAGGMRFLLLHLVYETQQTCIFFANIETSVNKKEYTKDILDIDADVDYIGWSKETHFKIEVEAFNLPEDENLELTKKNIWAMLDALPPTGSDKYVEFSRTDYQKVLQQILWNKCNNKQLYYALTNSIQQLKETLCRIGMKQNMRELSLEDGGKLYKGEELRFNMSEASKVISDFNNWKSDHDNDEETIKKYIKGKMYSEMNAFFKSGFLDSKISQQSEVDFSEYENEFDFERLKSQSTDLNVKAYYSAMRELFNYKNGILSPRIDKIGKYFFKYRKTVTEEHRASYFRFVKMLSLLEEEKKPKKKKEKALNYDGIKISMSRTYFPKFETALTENYNDNWLNLYMDALMESPHKEQLAEDWSVPSKRMTIVCCIIGVLKEVGVFKGKYQQLANLLKGENSRTLSNYIGKGKKHAILDWTKEYVEGQ